MYSPFNKHSTEATEHPVAWRASIALLVLVGITAMSGGLLLLIEPSGALEMMSVEDLSATIFSDYQIPGLILFFALGVLSVISAIMTFARQHIYPTLVFLQGAIVAGWILVQVYWLPEAHVLQLIYFLIGILLMLLGNFQKSKRMV